MAGETGADLSPTALQIAAGASAAAGFPTGRLLVLRADSGALLLEAAGGGVSGSPCCCSQASPALTLMLLVLVPITAVFCAPGLAPGSGLRAALPTTPLGSGLNIAPAAEGFPALSGPWPKGDLLPADDAVLPDTSGNDDGGR